MSSSTHEPPILPLTPTCLLQEERGVAGWNPEGTGGKRQMRGRRENPPYSPYLP